jgi:hypothetical protein
MEGSDLTPEFAAGEGVFDWEGVAPAVGNEAPGCAVVCAGTPEPKLSVGTGVAVPPPCTSIGVATSSSMNVVCPGSILSQVAIPFTMVQDSTKERASSALA